MDKHLQELLVKKLLHNYSAGLRIYCADRKKVIQECKNPIAKGDFRWIFTCNCDGTEQFTVTKKRGGLIWTF